MSNDDPGPCGRLSATAGDKPAALLRGVVNGSHDVFVGRLFAGDLLRIDPHGEFAAIADNEIRLDADGLLDCRRHTGGAGSVVSKLAVSDHDRGHHMLLIAV